MFQHFWLWFLRNWVVSSTRWESGSAVIDPSCRVRYRFRFCRWWHLVIIFGLVTTRLGSTVL